MPYGMTWDEFKPDGYSGNASGDWSETPYRLKKCATEGCGEDATTYFEAGGVGSLYCGKCAKAIKSFAAPNRHPTGR